MKNKSINNLIKVVMISGIVMMFNIGNVVNCFASDKVNTISDFCNKYEVVNNGKVDETPLFYFKNFTANDNKDVIYNYSNGSWYLYNYTTEKYIFKPLESDKEINFNNLIDLDECFNNYENIKELNESSILKNAHFNIETFSMYSCKVYVNNLKTEDDLKEYATQWLKDNYNLTLDIPIYYSELNKGYNDITHELQNGKFNWKTNTNAPISIEIEKEYNKVNIFAERTLVHELTHYALDKLGKPFNDDSKTFNTELLKNGGKNNKGEKGIFYSHLKSTT